ncbi:MAG: aldose epimerase family protein [Nibricoccus sp.]
MTTPFKIAAAAMVAVLAHFMPSLSAAPSVTSKPFGTVDGKPVELYTLRNDKGAEATITNYGGIVVSLMMPDRNGKMIDVVQGYDKVEDYVAKTPYFGALIGRYGNRIAKGEFTLDGKTYKLAGNDNGNALHGGNKGFDKVIWTAKPVESKHGAALELHYLSKDGDEGYPGNLDVTATYTLTNHDELRVDFKAKTDKATPVNLTHHSYFNLSGEGTILDHLLTINSDKTTPVDKGLIPTGELKSVEGTPFDFRKPIAIGARIDDPDTVLQYGPGYDHNWVVNQKKAGELGFQARVESPKSGIVLEVLSTEPAVQFYAGNFLDGTIKGKYGQVYQKRSGFCLEPQHYPDSPNHPNFPNTILKPGEAYTNTIVYKFSVKK